MKIPFIESILAIVFFVFPAQAQEMAASLQNPSEQAGAPAAVDLADKQIGKQLCAYLKDLKLEKEIKTDEWNLYCHPEAKPAELAKFRDKNPEKFAEYLKAYPVRRDEVKKAYEALKNDGYLKDYLKNDGDRDTSRMALSPLPPLSEPLNERTFLAWQPALYPADDELLRVYKIWVVAENAKLRKEKEEMPPPASEQERQKEEKRKEEINALLANNKMVIDRMNGIKDIDKFRCMIGEQCGKSQLKEEPMSVFTVDSVSRKDFNIDQDGRPYRLAVKVPGGSLDRGAQPPSPMGKSLSEISQKQFHGISMAGAAAAAGAVGVGVLGMFGFGSWQRARKEVKAQQKEFEEEPAKRAAEAEAARQEAEEAAKPAVETSDVSPDEQKVIAQWEEQTGSGATQNLDVWLSLKQGWGTVKDPAMQSLIKKIETKAINPVNGKPSN